MKRIFQTLAFTLAIGIPFTGNAQAVIFSNNIDGTNPSSGNPFTAGQVRDAHLTVSGISRGTGLVASTGNDRYNARGFDSPGLDTADYFEFTLTPDAGFDIDFTNFTYTSAASGLGPVNFAFRSSLDGFGTNLGAATVPTSTINLATPAFQNVTGAITFRLYAWGAPDALGTFSVNDFSFSAATPLPVRLSSFTLNKMGTAIDLQWKFSDADGGETVAVQRSSDAVSFQTITKMQLSENLSDGQNYRDMTPLSGINYYRLAITGSNGQVIYSKILSVLIDSKDRISFYPNPANTDIQLDWNNIALTMNATLYNNAGIVVYQQSYTGVNHATIAASDLPVGNYTIQLSQGGEINSKQILIAH